jgi:hypothetical protein
MDRVLSGVSGSVKIYLHVILSVAKDQCERGLVAQW